MWIRLTQRSMQYVRQTVAHDEVMSAEFRAECEWPKRATVDCNAAAVAWKHAQKVLYHRFFGPRGGRSQATSGFTALQRITKELNYAETHPALSGMAMYEWQADIFPAWKITPTDTDRRMYSIYPVAGAEFCILTPEWKDFKDGDGRITVWAPLSIGVGRLADESAHLALVR